MTIVTSKCLGCELPIRFEEFEVGNEISCPECGHDQVALPDSVRAVLRLVSEVHSSYCKELEKICPTIDMEYRWPMTIEVGAYVLLVLDFEMFHNKQAAASRTAINRFAEEVVLPFEREQFSKAIEHRLAAYGRALSNKPIADGIAECHAILSNYLIAAPKSLDKVLAADIPLHVVGFTSALQLRSYLVAFESALISPFLRALRNVFSYTNDITHVPGDAVDGLIDAAYDESP